jgi:3-polyprenyl-4-hydroxybenzoate decarboxylase
MVKEESKHKVIITVNQNDVNEYLAAGWLVKETHICKYTYQSPQNSSIILEGYGFCFILETKKDL